MTEMIYLMKIISKIKIMASKFQKAMLILGLTCAVLGIAISPNQHDTVLHFTIIFWIGNVYYLQTQLDKLSNK